jgi:probable phosphoglycerate mutase
MRSLDILLVRHGQTDLNAAGVLQGHSPTPLNELGRMQARQVARRLALGSPAIDELVSSDLPRAAQTAELIAEQLRRPIRFDGRWRELSFGELEGRAVGEREIWRNAGGDVEAPGGEKAVDFQQRIYEALTSLRVGFPNASTIAVVTHGGPIRTILRFFQSGRLKLAEGDAAPEFSPIINCSIMHLTHEIQGWRVMCMNDASHLDEATSRDVW